MNPETYARKHLAGELAEIEGGGQSKFHAELTIYEKALIYKYSSDGYLILNHKLRTNKGKNTTAFGKLLVQSLQKITPYSSIVY